MKHKKRFLRSIIFITAILISFFICIRVIGKKSAEVELEEYVNYEQNNFDVIFLGSSIMKNAVYPMELYQKYGILSYNLGSKNQSLVATYYLAKKLIYEQKPKVLVVDCIYTACDQYDINDISLHYTVDKMNWKEKVGFAFDILSIEKRADFLVEFTKRHNKWNQLEEIDFLSSRYKQYGAKVHYTSKSIDDFDIIEEKEDLPFLAQTYLYKIIDLCKENHISLVFTTIPVNFNVNHEGLGDMLQNQKYYNKIQEIASENDISYISYLELFQETKLDLKKDFDGEFYLNAYGAEKISSYIGEFLTSHYEILDVRNHSDYDFMEKDYIEFKNYKMQLQLRTEDDILNYLKRIRELVDCTVYISIKDIQGYSLTEEITNEMKGLGLELADILLEKSYHSYIACISDGEKILEEIGNGEECSYFEGEIGGHKVILESRTLNGGNMSSIKVDGMEYSKNGRGFNIVVIDNSTDKIIDLLYFDTHVKGIPCYR